MAELRKEINMITVKDLKEALDGVDDNLIVAIGIGDWEEDIKPLGGIGNDVSYLMDDKDYISNRRFLDREERHLKK